MDKMYLDWPVVTAQNVFGVVRELGIKPWKEARPNMPLSAWLSTANDADRAVYERFGPKPEVQFLMPPASAVHTSPSSTITAYGKEDIFFRMVYRPWVTVFALIPGTDVEQYVPLTAEWKQGNRLITLVPPSGVRGKAEADMDLLMAMHTTAAREFHEEVGIKLARPALLGPQNGFWDQVRGTELSFFPFLGRLEEFIERGPSKLDKNEFLKLVLFPLQEWLALLEHGGLEEGFALESCAVTTTYLALRALGKLQLLP